MSNTYFYVDPAAGVGGNGTKENPFSTVEQARDAVRALPDALRQSDICIYLRGGRYVLSQTIAFDNRDSGSESHPVVWRAYPGEKVIFDGGVCFGAERMTKLSDPDIAKRLVDPDAANHVYVLDLSGLPISYGTYGNRGFRRPYVHAPNELFINGVPQTIARYPKKEDGMLALTDVVDKGSVPRTGDFSLRPMVIRYNDARLERWASAEQACLSGFFGSSYADDNIEIAHIDPKAHTITTTLPHLYGACTEPFACWCIVNLLEELNAPGEYFIDCKAQKVYFIPPKSFDVQHATFQVSSLSEVMFAFENCSYLHLIGCTFENSRSSAIYIENGRSVKIHSCTMHNLGTLAVQFGKGASAMPEGRHTYHGQRDKGIPAPHPVSREMGAWHEYLYEFAAWDNEAGFDHMISDCDIYDTATGGVLLSGGNRKRLIPGNNTVHNCHFTRTNRLEYSCKGAVNMMGCGNRITHCEMHDLEGYAIYFYGNDHYIAYNRIHHVLKELSDAGAIYSGRDMSQCGNVIEKNFIYHIRNPKKDALGVCGVYLDDYMIYNRIYGNYFYDIVSDGSFFFSTIYYTCGGLSSIANNILIDCIPGLDPNVHGNAYYCMHSDKDVVPRVSTKDENDMRGVDVTSPIYRKRYPYLYETYVHNYHPGNCYYNNQVYYHNYSFFRDAEHMDFRFKPGAFMYNMPHEDFLVNDPVMGIHGRMVDMVSDLEFEKIGMLPHTEDPVTV